MSSSHADRQVLWEADVAHLKQTATELLETNSRYASMFEVPSDFSQAARARRLAVPSARPLTALLARRRS